MSAPRARGRASGRGRGGFRGRTPSQFAASRPLNTLATRLASDTVDGLSTTDPTPLPSGAVTPSAGAEPVKAKFSDFQGLSAEILRSIPFEHCTEVQAATLPTILEGHDLLAQAKTGTGKTLGFLIPTVQQLLSASPPPKSSTSVLILSPTRELAQQIGLAAESLLKNHQGQYGVKCVVGGTNLQRDIKDLASSRADILVATPGRLLDLIENANIGPRFAGIRSLILDEADRLLDQGFRRELVKIIEALPPRSQQQRQTLLFSATIPAEVHNIASLALSKDHRFISTLTDEDVNVHEHVIQESYVVPDSDVLAAGVEVILREQSLMQERGGFKVMAFLPTARSAAVMADIFAALPKDVDFPTWEVHSRMSQPARTKATEAFKKSATGVLFSSDVMARGIDVKGVTSVVQMGLPASAEQYVHRLGRTARAGEKGHGILVLGQFESSFLQNKTIQTFDLISYASASPESRSDARSRLDIALRNVTDEAKTQAYQAWLGYYNSNLKTLRWTAADLVRAANEFARESLQYAGGEGGAGQWKAPGLFAKTVGKMGLRGTPGLNVVKEPPKDHQQSRGGGGGARGPTSGGNGPQRGAAASQSHHQPSGLGPNEPKRARFGFAEQTPYNARAGDQGERRRDADRTPTRGGFGGFEGSRGSRGGGGGRGRGRGGASRGGGGGVSG